MPRPKVVRIKLPTGMTEEEFLKALGSFKKETTKLEVLLVTPKMSYKSFAKKVLYPKPLDNYDLDLRKVKGSFTFCKKVGLELLTDSMEGPLQWIVYTEALKDVKAFKEYSKEGLSLGMVYNPELWNEEYIMGPPHLNETFSKLLKEPFLESYEEEAYDIKSEEFFHIGLDGDWEDERYEKEVSKDEY